MSSRYVLKYIGQEKRKPYSDGDLGLYFERENNYVVDIEKEVLKKRLPSKDTTDVIKRIYTHLIQSDECVPYLLVSDIPQMALSVRNDGYIRELKRKYDDEIDRLARDGQLKVEHLRNTREEERNRVISQIDTEIADAMNEFETNMHQYKDIGTQLEKEPSETNQLKIEQQRDSFQGVVSSSEKKLKILRQQRDKNVDKALESLDRRVEESEKKYFDRVESKKQERQQKLNEALAMFEEHEAYELELLTNLMNFKRSIKKAEGSKPDTATKKGE